MVEKLKTVNRNMTKIAVQLDQQHGANNQYNSVGTENSSELINSTFLQLLYSKGNWEQCRAED